MPLLIIIFFSLSSFALELKDSEGKLFKFKEIAGNRVSLNCEKSCQALADYSLKVKDFKRSMGNPASEFCLHVGGLDHTASHPNLDQDSLCLFKDGSYILSWDLFGKNHKVAK